MSNGLYEEVSRLLQKSSKNKVGMPTIAKAVTEREAKKALRTGKKPIVVDQRWLNLAMNMSMGDPGVRKIQAVKDYFDSLKAKANP